MLLMAMHVGRISSPRISGLLLLYTALGGRSSFWPFPLSDSKKRYKIYEIKAKNYFSIPII